MPQGAPPNGSAQDPAPEGPWSRVAGTSHLPRDTIWTLRDFRANSATSKMLALMLAHANPVDLLTGQSIDVGKSLAWNNDKEYHTSFRKLT